MITLAFIISGCILMALCMGVGFLIGQFAGKCSIEARVIHEIEKKPTKENIQLGRSLFGNSHPDLEDTALKTFQNRSESPFLKFSGHSFFPGHEQAN